MPASKRVRVVIVGIAALFLVVGGVAYVKARRVLGDAVDMRNRAEVSIVLTDQGFVPQHVRVTKGTKLVFTTTRAHNEFWPASNPHPSHLLWPEFDPKKPIVPTESWSFVVDKVGVWGYHDHLRSYYTGVVYVDE